MSLAREIREISRNQTRLLEKEEKQQYEIELEKDILNCLKTNIEQAIYKYGANEVWLKQEKILSDTIKDLKSIVIEKVDMEQKQTSMNDIIINSPKYTISELEEYQIISILEDIFVKEVKKILQLLNLQEKAHLNKLAGTLEKEFENTYNKLKMKKFSKTSIMATLKQNKQRELSIDLYKRDYEIETIKKAHDIALKKVLDNHKYDIEQAPDNKDIPIGWKIYGVFKGINTIKKHL